ncbi:MAG: coniferyl aldehyde dehydrogenase, partial [Pseudomonadota bacterium]|nr:coniferyl aldehyde dehydrogenase [Pseudomonadota bacterium]
MVSNLNADLNNEGYAYLHSQLAAQKSCFLKTPMPSAGHRIDALNKLKSAIIDYSDRIVDSVSRDFGNRSESETLMAEIFPLLEAIEYSKKKLKKWMKPSRRKAPMLIAPATVEVQYQPLGVVGIVVPWNFPVFLGLSPLVSALASGNRAMIKTSEFAPRTAELVKELIESVFSADEVAVFTGEVDVSVEFTKLPFDHLVFTGATSVGRMVMRAASENLTPVTLELGGKSPVIIHDSFPIEVAAERIAFGKGLNAGQVCVSPDYILCPRHKVSAFAKAFADAVAKHYPTLRENSDYTSIISERQKARLQSYLDDAEAKGAKLLAINPENESFDDTRKMPVTLVLDTNEAMLIEQEEIFGPLLPVKAYDSIDEALDYVTERPRPLALYYFDWDRDRADEILRRTHSGGVCINDTMNHVAVDDAPFGGIGPSGMGHYHGKEGFLNFSKAKTI